MAEKGAAATVQMIARTTSHSALVETLFIVKFPYHLPPSAHMPDFRKYPVRTVAQDAGRRS
jgi:hypothetical protein